MPAIVPDLLPVFILIVLGAALGRSGFMSQAFADGAKRMVASVSLPALLFMAFARLSLQPSLFILAAVIFASCGVLGLAALPISALARLPRPATPLLFQGFEAGMLGYALFASLYGSTAGPAAISAFATADLGQVVYVFTILMAQLLAGEAMGSAEAAGGIGTGAGDAGRRVSPLVLVRGLASSPVIIAIVVGLLSAALFPGAAGLPWAKGGLLDPSLSAIGSLTTPLVCLVVGYNLRHGVEGGGSGFMKVLTAVLLRLAAAGGLGLVVAFVVVPALGLERINSLAVMVLFILPPPFVIAVFRKRPEDSSYVSSVLSLHTVASLVAVLAVALILGPA
jgi:malate permease and related proteins